MKVYFCCHAINLIPTQSNSTNDVMHNANLNKCTAFTLNFLVLAVQLYPSTAPTQLRLRLNAINNFYGLLKGIPRQVTFTGPIPLLCACL